MKRIIPSILCAILILSLVGCAGSTVSNARIDYGSSSIYTEADMIDAIEEIKKEFSSWDGCELHSLSYSGDDCNSADNIDRMNDLEEANNAKETFTQCIVFESSFRSPKKGGDGWNADTEYTGWSWWLARSEGGEWKLMTWGY